jgi:hypothetical protein
MGMARAKRIEKRIVSTVDILVVADMSRIFGCLNVEWSGLED